MTYRILLTVFAALLFIAVGCDRKEAQPGAEGEDAPKATEPATKTQPSANDEQAQEKQDDQKLDVVDVAEAGSKFDPPVKPRQLPNGAWYCDMGTVHWAGMKKPEDGNCPMCGMKLKEYNVDKVAAQKAKAVEAHEHGDHAHGGDEHVHEDGEHEKEEHGHPH